MKLTGPVLLVALLTTGCAALNATRVDASVYPPGVFQLADTDEAVLSEASHLVGLRAARPTTPAQWALGMADVEYVSGAFNTHARWLGIDALAQEQLLMARDEERQALGIPRAAPSQAVLDALLAVSHAGDASALQTALSNPVFTAGPQATLAHLNNMPTFSTMPYALADTNIAINRQNGRCYRIFC